MHKETINSGSGILKDSGPHIIDQALYLFGLPNAVFADIRITREHSLVDDYLDILLYYPDLRVRLKAGFLCENPILPMWFTAKRVFFEIPRRCAGRRIETGQKNQFNHLGNRKEGQEGLLHTEIDGNIIREKVPTLQGNYYDYFDGVYQAIANGKSEPVTAQEGVNVMRMIEAAIQSNEQKQVVNL